MTAPAADDLDTPARLTRFAPAPTGYLHLGHVANAVWTWGLARRTGADVLLRIEDHDRQRCRPEYEAALIEDLAWLGFRADRGPVRQTDAEAVAAYESSLARLRDAGLVYGCDCTRSTFARWVAANGRPWTGPGCPGHCRERGVAGPVLRVALGEGRETWTDRILGRSEAAVAPNGDLAVRDRRANWTYGFCVVVDDMRQGVDLVVRGEDLLAATAAQIRLGRALGREAPPAFAHHRLIRRPDGSKLSKSAGDTGVRELRAAGHAPSEVVGLAASATGYRAGSV
ncbi:MAG TPA: glutamate--tRNA ligase family protein [Candidatus Limnocylindrales bacterium]|nr:glutamate--tRNA ligase family protein [Candidatus Limnocylindrales bacterium]